MQAPPGETATQRQLRIKLGVVQRTKKELSEYHVEFAQQKAKIDRMRAEGKDEFDIKKQVEVLSETEIMIPDTMRRLAKGVEELADFVAVSGGELKGTDGLATAQALIAELAPADAGAAVDDDRI